jgi:hypothetical protein
MPTPYRDSIEALQERCDTLASELRTSRDRTRSLDDLRAQEARIEAELAEVSMKLGEMRQKRARLPLLENVKVASPCTADWNKMSGDAQVRFCGDCKKNVYNLSAMAAADAERLLQERAAGEMCVRLYRRTDGTVLTEDCPVGVKRKRRRKIVFGVASAGAMAAAAAGTFFGGATTGKIKTVQERPHVMGGIVAVDDGLGTIEMGQAPVKPPPAPKLEEHVEMGAKRR